MRWSWRAYWNTWRWTVSSSCNCSTTSCRWRRYWGQAASIASTIQKLSENCRSLYKEEKKTIVLPHIFHWSKQLRSDSCPSSQQQIRSRWKNSEETSSSATSQLRFDTFTKRFLVVTKRISRWDREIPCGDKENLTARPRGSFWWGVGKNFHSVSAP